MASELVAMNVNVSFRDNFTMQLNCCTRLALFSGWSVTTVCVDKEAPFRVGTISRGPVTEATVAQRHWAEMRNM